MLIRARIAVLVSGGGTNLEALLRSQERGSLSHGEIVLVCASRPGVYALTRAANHSVPAVVVERSGRSQEDFEAELQDQLIHSQADLIVLAGFLSILSADFCPPLAQSNCQRPPLPHSLLLWKGVLRPAGPRSCPGTRRESHRRHRPSGQ